MGELRWASLSLNCEEDTCGRTLLSFEKNQLDPDGEAQCEGTTKRSCD
jgi:hypothetical protein